MSDREYQVRECAYYFWEAEGRPQGRAQMHWTMAEIATTLFSYLNVAADKHPTPDRTVLSSPKRCECSVTTLHSIDRPTAAF